MVSLTDAEKNCLEVNKKLVDFETGELVGYVLRGITEDGISYSVALTRDFMEEAEFDLVNYIDYTDASLQEVLPIYCLLGYCFVSRDKLLMSINEDSVGSTLLLDSDVYRYSSYVFARSSLIILNNEFALLRAVGRIKG